MVDFLVVGGGQSSGNSYLLDVFFSKKVRYGINGIDKWTNVKDDKHIYVFWYTNIDIGDKELLLLKDYEEGLYRRYDNYDIINIDNINNIPDYDEVMGVPITFFNKWNYNQFDVVGLLKDAKIDGNNKFYRLLIRRKK